MQQEIRPGLSCSTLASWHVTYATMLQLHVPSMVYATMLQLRVPSMVYDSPVLPHDGRTAHSRPTRSTPHCHSDPSSKPNQTSDPKEAHSEEAVYTLPECVGQPSGLSPWPLYPHGWIVCGLDTPQAYHRVLVTECEQCLRHLLIIVLCCFCSIMSTKYRTTPPHNKALLPPSILAVSPALASSR